MSTNLCLRFLLNCFVRGIKGFYQSSLRNEVDFEVDFRNIMNVFPNILAKRLDMVCRWKSTDNNDINIFLSLENPCTFLLGKEKTWKCTFNTNIELSQNRTEKQIMPFKTTSNWLFSEMWYYLVIGCFDWKFGVFQQTIVRGLLYS